MRTIQCARSRVESRDRVNSQTMTARLRYQWWGAGLCVLVMVAAMASARTRTQAPAIEDGIRLRIEQARQQPAAGIRGARLQQPEAIARFFETRAFAPAWKLPAAAAQMLTAIRNIEQDGLTPAELGIHSRRTPAGFGGDAAGGSGQLDAGAHSGSRRLYRAADRLPRDAAASPDRVLDRLGRHDGELRYAKDVYNLDPAVLRALGHSGTLNRDSHG